jgi:hypothetical protein
LVSIADLSVASRQQSAEKSRVFSCRHNLGVSRDNRDAIRFASLACIQIFASPHLREKHLGHLRTYSPPRDGLVDCLTMEVDNELDGECGEIQWAARKCRGPRIFKLPNNNTLSIS